MKKALKHRKNAVISDLDAAEILQPGVGALDFPTLPVASQLAFILEAPVADVLSVGDDQLRSTPIKSRAQGVGIVAAVGNNPFEMGARPSSSSTRNLHRRSVLSAKPALGQSARTQVALRQVCRCRRPPPCTSYLSRDVFCRLPSPLFCRDKGGVQKGFFPIQQPALVQHRQQFSPRHLPYALFLPPPQSTPTGRAIRVLLGHDRAIVLPYAEPTECLLSTRGSQAQGRPRPSLRRFGSGNNGSKILHCSSLSNSSRFFIRSSSTTNPPQT